MSFNSQDNEQIRISLLEEYRSSVAQGLEKIEQWRVMLDLERKYVGRLQDSLYYISKQLPTGGAALPNVPREDLEQYITDMSRLREYIDNQIRQGETFLGNSTGTLYYAATTAGTAVALTPTPYQHHAYVRPIESASGVVDVSHAWRIFRDREIDLQQPVVAEMKRLRFPERQPGIQAIDQFRVAWEVHLTSPSTAPYSTSSLLPLRSAVNSAVDALWQLRPSQVPANELPKAGFGKDGRKVMNICSQLGKAMLSEPNFERIAEEADAVLNELSGSKQGNRDRDIEVKLFDQASLLLMAFLSAIDETKLRD